MGLTETTIQPGPATLPKRVLVVQRILPHYRVPFFDALHDQLAVRGIDMQVVYGQHAPGTVPQSVSLRRSWARFVTNRYLILGGFEFVWQPAMRLTTGADLVIIEHAARLLGNYPLLARRWFGKGRLAFWGHGANLQARRPDSYSERFKRRLTSAVDWWFAYTESSLAFLRRSGYPAARVSVVQNSIDDSELRDAVDMITESELTEARRSLGIKGKHCALYCGGMYPDKRLDFLLDACRRLRELIPDFEIVFVGSGPYQDRVNAACVGTAWMHFVGPVYGSERARYFAMCEVLLAPAAVGLVVVDSFVAGVPIFTTDIATHGPEIAYVKNGSNGVITQLDVDEYARTVADYLRTPRKLERLRGECRASGEIYTLKNMVNNFAAGVEACLAAERR